MKLSELKRGQVVTEKLSKEIIKQDKNSIIYLVPAYTGTVKDKNLTFQGASECTVPVASEEALKHWKDKLTVKDLEDISRQRLTDCKNNVRTEENLDELLKKVANGTATQAELKKVGTKALSGALGADLQKGFMSLLTGK